MCVFERKFLLSRLFCYSSAIKVILISLFLRRYYVKKLVFGLLRLLPTRAKTSQQNIFLFFRSKWNTRNYDEKDKTSFLFFFHFFLRFFLWLMYMLCFYVCLLTLCFSITVFLSVCLCPFFFICLLMYMSLSVYVSVRLPLSVSVSISDMTDILSCPSFFLSFYCWLSLVFVSIHFFSYFTIYILSFLTWRIIWVSIRPKV